MLPAHRMFWGLILLAAAGAGLLYNIIFADAAAPLAGFTYGLCMGATVLAFDRGLILAGLQARIRRLPAWLYVVAAELAYVLMIVAGNALGGLIVWSLGLTGDELAVATRMTARVLAYALAVAGLLVFVIRMRDLVGGEIFVNFMIGRYHKPVAEERIFLFLDVTGSTRFADRYGDRAAQAYLGQVFNALALPVSRARGSIDDYIGDMALVTWTIERGTRDAACLRCVFDFAARLAEESEAWTQRFGQVPEFRAALHCGPVVTAEVGLERHKIAYFGDVVNTTARLESLSKSLGVHVLVSADLLDRIGPLPLDLTAENLGAHALRGREAPLAVAAIRQQA